MFYSKSTKGFYSTELHGANMPGDVVAITPAEYTTLISAQSAGKLITVDANGKPQVVDPVHVPFVDPAGFAQAIKICLGGIVAANALAVAYPLFFTAVQIGHWPDVQTLILDAKTKNLITTQQYADIKASITAYNIPVTL